jgi:tRNA U34 5-carboxymethylaminomethyl modifying enzyme MnmG/GidA
VIRLVDLVVAGGDAVSVDAAIAAARRGQRVLMVIGPDDRTGVDHVRRALQSAGAVLRRRVTLMAEAEIVCVDGVGGVEAVPPPTVVPR